MAGVFLGDVSDAPERAAADGGDQLATRTGRRHIGHMPDRGPLQVLARTLVIYGLVAG
jgi:hypothetical protein